MDKQNIFKVVSEHLQKQGQPCTDSEGSCQYYNPYNHTKCAVGALMTDDLYDSSFEGLTISELFDRRERYRELREVHGESETEEKLVAFFEKYDIKSPDDIAFLRQLQRIHDSHMPSEWTTLLKFLAANNNILFTTYFPTKESNNESAST